MELINFKAITTDRIQLPISGQPTVDVDVLRLDKIHPLISGNKWFKLQYYLEEAIQSGTKVIATCGGAYSNHILAVAAACRLNKLRCIGYIRGEEPAQWSSTLSDAYELGMELRFVSRQDYASKTFYKEAMPADTYFIEEGGYGLPGAKGAAEILKLVDLPLYSHICCAVGTGTMMSGLLSQALPGQEFIGIPVLKNNYALASNILSLQTSSASIPVLLTDYHFGGYAKSTPELFAFMNAFYLHSQIATDFVYTGKLCFAINDLAASNYFPAGSRILVIHSGGLQGNKSLSNGTLMF